MWAAPRPSFVLKAEEWGCAHHRKGARNAHLVGVWIYFANVMVPKRPLTYLFGPAVKKS
jgi:hypothetical protein